MQRIWWEGRDRTNSSKSAGLARSRAIPPTSLSLPAYDMVPREKNMWKYLLYRTFVSMSKETGMLMQK